MAKNILDMELSTDAADKKAEMMRGCDAILAIIAVIHDLTANTPTNKRLIHDIARDVIVIAGMVEKLKDKIELI